MMSPYLAIQQNDEINIFGDDNIGRFPRGKENLLVVCADIVQDRPFALLTGLL